MPLPPELQAADTRMTTAQKAMLDFIDSGGTDLQVRYALLEELDASMANFNEKLAEFLKLWKT